jgi:hypothetical protein|tara:strand:- start:329 stop:586 length:258 start_codon:yes stop_codon:yes gene_type:complete
MGKGIYWSTTPHLYVAEAKASAKAALSESSPKLTALQRAFYNAQKRQQCPTATRFTPQASPHRKAAKKSTATSKEEQSSGKAQPP